MSVLKIALYNYRAITLTISPLLLYNTAEDIDLSKLHLTLLNTTLQLTGSLIEKILLFLASDLGNLMLSHYKLVSTITKF